MSGLISLSRSLLRFGPLGRARLLPLATALLMSSSVLAAAAQPGSASRPLIMAQMGEMGGGSRPKPFYPSLVDVPTLSAEARRQIEQQARIRINAGNEALTRAQSDYHSAMTIPRQWIRPPHACATACRRSRAARRRCARSPKASRHRRLP